MSEYIYRRGVAALTARRNGGPAMGVRGGDDIALGSALTIMPGGPEPIAGVVDDITNFVTQHPIEAALAAVAGWAVGPKILHALTGRGRRR